jgi:hypothetical protein
MMGKEQTKMNVLAQLRKHKDLVGDTLCADGQCLLCNAADEIERLRDELLSVNEQEEE